MTVSKRQLTMANLVMQGLTNKEIARKLGITPNTVRETLHKVFGKLGISSRVQLALWANAHIGMDDYDHYDR